MGVVMVNVTIMLPLYYHMTMRLPVIMIEDLQPLTVPWGCVPCAVFWVTPRTKKTSECWHCNSPGQKFMKRIFTGWDTIH